MGDGQLEVCFRFVRDAEIPLQDDIVSIRPEGPNFVVTSKIVCNAQSNKRIWSRSTMSKHAVIKFSEDMMKLACMDSLPFLNVQIDLPCSPSFSFDLPNGKLHEAREVVVRMLDTCLSSWPEVVDREHESRKRMRRECIS